MEEGLEGISVEQVRGGRRFVLPRPLPAWRWQAALVLCLGMGALSGFVAITVLMGVPWRSMILDQIEFVAFASFFATGLILLGLRLALATYGRIAVEVVPGEVRQVLRLAGLTLRQRRSLAGTLRMGIARGAALARFGESPRWLRLELPGQKPLRLAAGQPVEVLEALRDLITDELGSQVQVLALQQRVDAVPSSPQPAETGVAVEELAAGLRIRVPPAGLRGCPRPLIQFALAWLGFLILLTVIIASKGPFARDGSLILGLLGIGWIAGLALLFVVVAVGRTRATIEVAGGRLQVELDNLLHTRVREWKRGEIQAIRVRHIEKPSGHRDPVAELQVLGGDRPLGFLAGRPEEELRWIAGVIQKALQTRPARRRHRPV